MNYRLLLHCITAAAILIASGPTFSTSITDADNVTDKTKSNEVDLHTLLDPESATSARAAELSTLERLANDQKNAWAQYKLGTLYRLGTSHPAQNVATDPDKARLFLSNAAAGGEVFAMAGLAELELSQNKPLDALVWTHLFIRYTRDQGALEEELLDHRGRKQSFGSSSGYEASLIMRCQTMLGDSDEAAPERIDAYMRLFVERYDKTITEYRVKKHALNKVSAEKTTEDTRLFNPRNISVYGHLDYRLPSAISYFLLEISPKGNVSKVLIEDALPDIAATQNTLVLAKHMHFNKVAPTTPIRNVRIPVAFSSGSHRLIKE